MRASWWKEEDDVGGTNTPLSSPQPHSPSPSAVRLSGSLAVVMGWTGDGGEGELL